MSDNPIAGDNVVESVALYYRDGNSDKVYLASIKAVPDGHIVDFAFGRRGAALKTGLKTQKPVALEAAQKIYRTLVGEKTAKGYTPDAAGLPFRHSDLSGRVSGYNVQLLNPLDETAALALLADPAWVAQEKFDGDRRMVQIRAGKAEGINRRGLFVSLPVEVERELVELGLDAVLDGELVGTSYHVFDILELARDDVRPLGVEERLRILEGLLTGRAAANVRMVETAATSEEKRALHARVVAAGGEGLVFKRTDAPYVAGRPASGGNQMKFKLWESASVRVGATNDQRSVALEILGPSGWLPAGNVTIPANHDVPVPGSVVEVRYLYAFPGTNALFQPTYLGPRTDIEMERCTIDQLKFKAA